MAGLHARAPVRGPPYGVKISIAHPKLPPHKNWKEMF